jgi:hypothetical protein
MAEPERYRKFATMEAAFKARLRGDRELMCIFWGRWREIMRVWNYMLVMRHDVKRRTFLLDEIREKYLKDVMAVKAALAHAAKNVLTSPPRPKAQFNATQYLCLCAHPRLVHSQTIVICARFIRVN